MTPEQRAVFDRIVGPALASQSGRPYLIGVSGKDAAGKTMFCDALATYLGTKTAREVIRISMDDFMNPQTIRNTPTSSLAESAYLYTFDTESFKKYALQSLSSDGNKVYKPKVFDEATDTPDVAADRQAPPDAIIIIDGVLLFKADMADFFDLKVMLDVSDDTALRRGAERDKRRGKYYTDIHELYAYRSTYIACQAMYYREDRPLERADIVIDNDDFNYPRLYRG